mmetsp:Transcript_18305/g.57573  ORF Transcript_18305/g.57573 Transcript_18305/m.57573 type:complete len:872 (+) Transcript_18305:85-2700(+)
MAGGKKKSSGGGGPHHDLALTLTSVLVITGVLCLQVTARKLKLWSEHHGHASEVLEATEREMTVLGMIAFALFVLEEVAQDAKGEWYAVFHEVHFALFTIAVFFIGVNVSLYKMGKKYGLRWRKYEDEDVTDHKHVVTELRQLRKKLRIRPLDQHLFFGTFWIGGLATDPFAWFAYQDCLERMSFHEIRRDFLRSHQLPHEFEFADYLESCLQHVCIEFSEIRDSVWVLGVLGLVAHSYATTLAATPDITQILLVLSVAVVALGFIVFIKVKYIYWYVLHSEVVYSAGDDVSTQPQRSIQRSLFWFGNPGLVVTLLEVCLFVLATTFSILVFNVRELASKNQLAIPVVAFVLAAAALAVLLPRILPRFTLITHVGEMTDSRQIAETVTKQQRRGALGYEKIKVSSRRHKRPSARKGLRYAWDTMIVAPAISTLSALLAIVYVFAIAVTLDDTGARAVLGNGGVVAVRSVELGLNGFFLIESTVRLLYDPRSCSRILDSINCAACACLAVAHHVIWHTSESDASRRVARIIHAASVTIVLRVFNTAWHRELVQPRFEHMEDEDEDEHHHSSRSLDKSLRTVSTGCETPAQVFSRTSFVTSPSAIKVLDDGAVLGESTRRITPSRPAWLTHYVPPMTASVVKADDRGATIIAAEALVHHVLNATFEDLADSDSAPDELARVALQRSLSALPDSLQGITSTDHEQLEDALYFNHVLLDSVASVARGKKKALLFGVEDDNLEWLEVKLLLTRDQIVYYRLDSRLSEFVNGKVRDILAASSNPETIALDIPGSDPLTCQPPAGRLHLSTLLKIDAKDATCHLTTTAHVFHLQFDSSDLALRWKSAVEDAVEKEDDDEVLATHATRAGIVPTGEHLA